MNIKLKRRDNGRGDLGRDAAPLGAIHRLVRFVARRFEPVGACSEGYPYSLKIIN